MSATKNAFTSAVAQALVNAPQRSLNIKARLASSALLSVVMSVAVPSMVQAQEAELDRQSQATQTNAASSPNAVQARKADCEKPSLMSGHTVGQVAGAVLGFKLGQKVTGGNMLGGLVAGVAGVMAGGAVADKVTEVSKDCKFPDDQSKQAQSASGNKSGKQAAGAHNLRQLDAPLHERISALYSDAVAARMALEQSHRRYEQVRLDVATGGASRQTVASKERMRLATSDMREHLSSFKTVYLDAATASNAARSSGYDVSPFEKIGAKITTDLNYRNYITDENGMLAASAQDLKESPAAAASQAAFSGVVKLSNMASDGLSSFSQLFKVNRPGVASTN